MASWKGLQGIAQSYSHHLQSYFGYIVPHIAEEFVKTGEKVAIIELLPVIKIAENLRRNTHLLQAVEYDKNIFLGMIAREGFELDCVREL